VYKQERATGRKSNMRHLLERQGMYGQDVMNMARKSIKEVENSSQVGGDVKFMPIVDL